MQGTETADQYKKAASIITSHKAEIKSLLKDRNMALYLVLMPFFNDAENFLNKMNGN
jgi:hypothetical protein